MYVYNAGGGGARGSGAYISAAREVKDDGATTANLAPAKEPLAVSLAESIGETETRI